MLWRPDASSVDPSECLWRRSTLALRAHAWYVGLQPQGADATFEVGEDTVIAYADGRVAGHAVRDAKGGVAITVAPEFRGRGIEDGLVAQTTRWGRCPGSWADACGT